MHFVKFTNDRISSELSIIQHLSYFISDLKRGILTHQTESYNYEKELLINRPHSGSISNPGAAMVKDTH